MCRIGEWGYSVWLGRLMQGGSRAYRQDYGDVFTSAIPTNVFGPHDN